MVKCLKKFGKCLESEENALFSVSGRKRFLYLFFITKSKIHFLHRAVTSQAFIYLNFNISSPSACEQQKNSLQSPANNKKYCFSISQTIDATVLQYSLPMIQSICVTTQYVFNTSRSCLII